MKHLSIILAALLLLVPSLGFAAATCVEGTPQHPCGDLWYIDIVCTAHTDASFTDQVTTDSYCGYLYAFSVDPGATGPTDNSDLEVFQTMAGAATTVDTLATQGANTIDNTANNFVLLTAEAAVCGPLAIDMDNNAVNSASFTLRLYLRIPGTD